jgi:hypothetical protein
MEQHLPTELEIGIQEMSMPFDHPIFVAGEPRPITTNSFHAPQDSDSEGADDEHPIRAWKPFIKDIQSIPDVQIISPPIQPVAVETVVKESFIREHSTSTSVNGDIPTQPHVIDLTSENPWVEAEPVHVECIEINSEVSEDDYSEEYSEEDDYDEYEEEERPDYVPYEYDTEDKESVNGGTQMLAAQVPETQFFQTVQNPPIVVTSLLLNQWLIVEYC